MRRYIVLFLVMLATLFLSFEAKALLLEFKNKNALDVWKPSGGTWELKDGVLWGKTAVNTEELILNTPGSDKWTDYTFEVKGKSIAERFWGVNFRQVDFQNNYRLNIYEDLDATNNFYIYKKAAGAFTEVMKVPVGKIDKDTWYTLTLSITKNAMKAYLNGELKIEAEDKTAPFDAGTLALQGGVDFEIEYVKIDGKGIPATAVESKDKLATFWGSLKR